MRVKLIIRDVKDATYQKMFNHGNSEFQNFGVSELAIMALREYKQSFAVGLQKKAWWRPHDQVHMIGYIVSDC